MPKHPDGPPDFDPEERELFGELQLKRCPDVRLLSAYSEGVLPEELAGDVGQHVASCAICTTVLGDLKAVEPGGPSPEQLRRIRSRIPTDGAAKSAVSWFAFAAAAAAIAVLALVFWLPRRQLKPAARAGTTAPPTEEAKNTIAFQPLITKAPIEIDADTALAWRGARNARRPPFNDWALALKPYKEERFADASQQLARIVHKYPDFADGYFYLGVSQLMLGQNQNAAVSLARAEQLAKGERSGSAAWYLGAAYFRSNRETEAGSQWYKSCHIEGPDAQQACDALARIKH